MSPNRTQIFPLDQSQSPDLPQSPALKLTQGMVGEAGVRASLDSKIQGFGQSSQGGPNTTHRLAQEAIHGIDISGQDFTIEEKLHEESYLSKDNF